MAACNGDNYDQVSLLKMSSTSDSCKWLLLLGVALNSMYRWDGNSAHLLLRLVPSLKPIGVVRPIHTPNYYKLSRLAVLEEYRRFSFGRALVHGLHDWVRSDAMKRGCKGEVKIRTHSQLPVKGFYTK